MQDLPREYNPFSGDCSSVAEGLRRVFGGHLEAISSVPHERYFDHTVLVVNNNVYDGRGRVSRAKIEQEFVSRNNWKAPEAHWFTVKDITRNSMYDDEIANSVSQAVQTAIDNILSS